MMDHTCDQSCFGMCGKCSRWIISAVGVFLSLFLFAKALHEFKLFGLEGRNFYPSNVVTVTGEGEAVAIPNVASFSYSVIEEAKTVDVAQTKATEKENKAIEYLKSNGIEDKDIKTTAYSVNPKYEYQQIPCIGFACVPGKQVLVGYEVSQSISVKIRKTEDAGKILGGLGALKVSNVSGLEFTVDDESILKTEARKDAIADAQNKAEAIAKELDVKFVRVISFFEEGDQPMPYYAKEGMGMGTADVRSMSVSVAPVIPSGENKVTSKVTITYEIK